MKQYIIYILRCSDGHYYIGVTNNIERRLWEHQHGWDKSCYTYRRRPVELVYQEQFRDVEQAIAREKQLKGWTVKKKEALIAGDWERLKILSKSHGSTGSP
jgi:putative endonuclease